MLVMKRMLIAQGTYQVRWRGPCALRPAVQRKSPCPRSVGRAALIRRPEDWPVLASQPINREPPEPELPVRKQHETYE